MNESEFNLKMHDQKFKINKDARPPPQDSLSLKSKLVRVVISRLVPFRRHTMELDLSSWVLVIRCEKFKVANTGDPHFSWRVCRWTM
jgi:hypothetical protein